jgi:NAD(P)-dependent dehydrogenase (short-subunit alcohol dehydrogenase family)
MSTNDLYAPTNVATKYPQPPFPKQQQDGAGSFSEMDPVPDHGEQSYRGSGKLIGRRALITGGDSGIGRAVAIAFAREGADVVLNYLPEEQHDAESTAALLRADGARVELLPGDLADEQFCASLVEESVAALGGLDLLVMVGGQMPTVDSILDFDTEVWNRLVATNLSSLFWLSKAARPHLEAGASIIATSSIQGFKPSPSLVEYAVTKAGIANFVRGMAQQLAEDGIRVNGVAPGPFWTPLQPASVPVEKVESFGSEASQESSYTSGEIIAVTGATPVH